MALRHYTVSLDATAEKRICFPRHQKPPRFLPSIAQKAISASSFGHHQFQPRAKNDTRLQPKGGGTTTSKTHKSLGITQKTTRSRPDSISLKFTHRNSLKIHSFIQPATQSASRTQPRVSDWTLVKKSLDRWAPTYLPRPYQMSRQRAAEARHIHTHPSIHTNKTSRGKARHTCAEHTKKRRPQSRRPPSFTRPLAQTAQVM